MLSATGFSLGEKSFNAQHLCRSQVTAKWLGPKNEITGHIRSRRPRSTAQKNCQEAVVARRCGTVSGPCHLADRRSPELSETFGQCRGRVRRPGHNEGLWRRPALGICSKKRRDRPATDQIRGRAVAETSIHIPNHAAVYGSTGSGGLSSGRSSGSLGGSLIGVSNRSR